MKYSTKQSQTLICNSSKYSSFNSLKNLVKNGSTKHGVRILKKVLFLFWFFKGTQEKPFEKLGLSVTTQQQQRQHTRSCNIHSDFHFVSVSSFCDGFFQQFQAFTVVLDVWCKTTFIANIRCC